MLQNIFYCNHIINILVFKNWNQVSQKMIDDMIYLDSRRNVQHNKNSYLLNKFIMILHKIYRIAMRTYYCFKSDLYQSPAVLKRGAL